MKRRVWILMAIVSGLACDPKRHETLMHRMTVLTAAEARAQADRARDAAKQLDYARPDGTLTFTMIADLYLKACLAGDESACWEAQVMSTKGPAEAEIERLCERGRTWSCRAAKQDTELSGVPKNVVYFGQRRTSDPSLYRDVIAHGQSFN